MATILYMIGGLATLGYFLNKDPRIKEKKAKKNLIKENEKPSGEDIYNSRHLEKVWQQEFKKVSQRWKQSEDPVSSNIIGPVHKNRQDSNYSGPHISANKIKSRYESNTSTNAVINNKLPNIKDLTNYGTQSMNSRRRALSPLNNQKGGWGNIIKDNGHLSKSVKVFEPGTHNNMEPFFGGTVKQNIDPYAHRSKLESFTGANPIFQHKKEVKPMFAPEKNHFIHGLPVRAEDQLDRYEPSMKKTNILPFKQMKISPGLDGQKQQGFQDYYRPTYKTTDELRVNPKSNYKGRVIGEGARIAKRTKIVPVISRKNVDLSFSNDPKSKNKYYREMLKNTLGGSSKGTVNSKDTIILEQTQRDMYGDKLKEFQGGARGEINKEYIVPDMRVSNKPTYTIGGDHNPTGPNKKNIAYNLDQKMRTTIRQDTQDNVHNMINFNSELKGRTTNPYDQAKTTTKEQFVNNEYESINVGGIIKNKGISYDDEKWRPQVTIREQFEDNKYETVNVGGVYKKLTSYDDTDLAKNTIRQQTENHEHSHINAQDSNREATRNPYDQARMTIKEQTGGLTKLSHARGNNNAFKLKSLLQDDAKSTIKQQVMTENYMGQGKDAKGSMGRQNMYNAEINALKELTIRRRKPTQQGVKVAPSKKQYNVETNKISFNTYNTNRRIQKAYEPASGIRPQITSQKQMYQDHQQLNNRLNPELLNVFKSNPYTQKLDSHGYLFNPSK